MRLDKDVDNISQRASRVVLESLETIEALGFVLLDAQGMVVRANRMARNLLGFDESSEPHISWESFFLPEDRSSELPQSHQVICANEGEYHVHSSLLSSRKEKIDACLLYKSIEDSQGKEGEDGFCIFIKDNSYVRKIENELQELRKSFPVEGGSSSSLRELCHKLRSPLTLISLSVNLLRDYSEKMSPEERSEELKQIEEGLYACEKAVANVSLPSSSPPKSAHPPVR